MPRKPGVDPKFLLSELKRDENRIFQKGKVVGPSCDVWYDIQLRLNIPMTPKAIYTFAKKHFGNNENISQGQKADLNDLFSNSDVSSSSEENCDYFTFVLSHDEWKKVKPQSVIYKRNDRSEPERVTKTRTYNILEPGVWTDVFASAIYSKKHLPCALTFKRLKIHPNSGKTFLRFAANCRECGVNIHGELADEPKEGEPVYFLCKISGNCNVTHKGSKRRLCGLRRQEVSQMLINQKIRASKFRKEQILKDNCNLFEAEPCQLPPLSVLRKAKSEMLNKDRITSDPINGIELLKLTEPFSHAIRDIGLDRFFVHYWSTNQIRLYNMYCKTKKFPKISIDATGSICKKINRHGKGKSSHIFLYCVVINIRERKTEGLISVSQMLSERHHRNAISFWLKEWIRSGAHLPKECVTDFSLALLSASTETFTAEKTLEEYLRTCFKMLYESYNETPACFIRVDVAHVINLVRKWPVFSGKSNRFKELYIKAVGQLVLCSDVTIAQDLIEAVIIISQSASEGISASTKQPTACELRKRWLKESQMTGHLQNICDAFQKNEEFDVDEPDGYEDKGDDETFPANNFSRKIEEIKLSCLDIVKKDDYGDRDNLHYSPELINFFCELCKKLPLWTNIMKPFFKYSQDIASSSAVEGYFGQLKTNLIEKGKPVDVFLREHIIVNEGSMLISSNVFNYDTMTSEEGKSPEDSHKSRSSPEDGNFLNKAEEVGTQVDTLSHNNYKEITTQENAEMNAFENWKNLAKPQKIIKRARYLKSLSSNEIDDDLAFQNPIKIGCLKNGHVGDLKSVRYGNISFSLSNTCAFDALIQGLAVSFSDSIVYRDFIISENNILSEIVSAVASAKITNNTYKLRCDMLRNIFTAKESKAEGLYHIDCATNVAHIIKNVMPPTLRETRTCDDNHKEEKKFDVITIELSEEKQISSLNQLVRNYLDYYSSKNNCHFPKCPKQSSIRQNLGLYGHIIIDIPDYLDFRDTGKVSENFQRAINTFPIILKIMDEEFFLRAIISFIPPAHPAGIGHYKAFCRRINGTWEVYDDCLGYKQDIRSNQKVNAHAIIYTL